MFFPQLYTITSYSLLQSTIRIREYVQEAKTRLHFISHNG